MKIFIIYASAGSGHFRAAEAIYNYFKEKNQDLELKLIDILGESNILFKSIYSYGYTFLVTYLSWLWALCFRITYARPLRTVIDRIHFIINRLNTKRLNKFLIQENPHFIISTHFLPSEITAYLKRKQKINSKLFTVITDFGAHPFWINNGTDIYIVASDFTKEQLILRGITPDNIKVFGIPIDQKFLKHYEKNALCKKFGIEEKKITVLIVTGSFGIGPIEKIVGLLYKEVRVLVVCAKNRALYARLKNKNYPNVLVFGFLDNLQELMVISDIIITKPGGLSISEILAMDLVPLFIFAIPGQETENVKVLERCGLRLNTEDTQDIKGIILDYMDNPDKLNKIKEKIRSLRKPTATQELYNVICQSSIGTSG